MTSMEELLSRILEGRKQSLATDAISTTLIQEAMKQKRIDVVEWLINEELVYISNKTAGDNTFTLLKIEDSILEILEYLNNLDYTIVTLKLKYFPVHNALRKPAVLRWLLQHGGDNIKELIHWGSSLLHTVCQENLFDCFYLLSELEADINARGRMGNTPLHYAVGNSKEIARALILRCFNINLRDENNLIFNFNIFTTGEWKDVLVRYLYFIVRVLVDPTITPLRRSNFESKLLTVAKFFAIRPHMSIVYSVPGLHLRWKNMKKVAEIMPIIPSLQELSRNKVREAIGRKFPNESPSSYLIYFEQLPIPALIVDIIRLKRPIYRDFTL